MPTVMPVSGLCNYTDVLGQVVWSPISTGVPCHRVVFKDGSLAPGFAFGGPHAQRSLLESEGVTFLPDGRVNLPAHTWEA